MTMGGIQNKPFTHHKMRSCLTKKTYGTRGEAKEKAYKGCHPYKCRWCGFWHNGHPPRWNPWSGRKKRGESNA